MFMSLDSELNRIGSDIIKDAKRLVLRNKKSGDLVRSLGYEIDIKSISDFSINISELEYGKYLNNKTKYMDKAIDDNINNIDSLIEILLNDIIKINDK